MKKSYALLEDSLLKEAEITGNFNLILQAFF